MYKVELSAESAEHLFKDMILRDYGYIVEEADELLQKKGLWAYENEDLAYYLRLREAMHTVLTYYLTDTEYKDKIGETADSK
jgi:hypothetical protein